MFHLPRAKTCCLTTGCQFSFPDKAGISGLEICLTGWSRAPILKVWPSPPNIRKSLASTGIMFSLLPRDRVDHGIIFVYIDVLKSSSAFEKTWYSMPILHSRQWNCGLHTLPPLLWRIPGPLVMIPANKWTNCAVFRLGRYVGQFSLVSVLNNLARQTIFTAHRKKDRTSSPKNLTKRTGSGESLTNS